MLKEKLKAAGFTLVLASGSPRRQQFLQDLDLPYEIRLKEVDEIYPKELVKEEISDFLAVLKASVHKVNLLEKEILITSDTIVWHNNTCLGKPRNEAEAVAMLKELSNDNHLVITSICVTTPNIQEVEHCITKVNFKELKDEEISYYVRHFQPYDKAGGYGIQEWIGHIAVDSIEGSYNNVMGLPTHILYKMLMRMVS